MVQLIFYALVGVVGWYAYKAITKEMNKVSDKVREKEKEKPGVDANNVAELEQDPDTGVYKLKKRD